MKPNVLWLVIDALRADSLSCYGYGKETSPNIDKFAEKSRIFENAFSAGSWTSPSHASMFTGKYPFRHGMLNPDLPRLRDKTVADILSKEDYETLMIAPSPQIAGYRGLNKGFKRTIESYRGKFNYKDPALWYTFLRSLFMGWDNQTHYFNQIIKREMKKARRKNKPSFIFVNNVAVHWPYNPPRGFRKFSYPKGVDEDKMRKVAGQKNFISKVFKKASRNYVRSYLKGELELSQKELFALKSFYDNELCYLDYELGKLFNFLEKENFMENTLIILTSDHGELFGEHGLLGHCHCLYEPLIRVPLILYYPNIVPKRVNTLVSLVDLFPTILDITGVEKKEEVDGISLLGKGGEYHDYVIAQSRRPEEKKERARKSPKLSKIDNNLDMIRTKRYGYIMGNKTEELYDVKRDPEEEDNIISEKPKVARKLRSRLQKELRKGEKREIRERVRKLKFKNGI